MVLDLDVNTDLYPLEIGDKFSLALAPTLSLDGAPDAGARPTAAEHAAPRPLDWRGRRTAAGSAALADGSAHSLAWQACTTRATRRRCSTHTSTPCTERSTSGSRRSRMRPCACSARTPTPLSSTWLALRAPRKPDSSLAPPAAPQRGVRVLRRPADATARRLEAPAEAGARQPNLPADAQDSVVAQRRTQQQLLPSSRRERDWRRVSA